MSLIGSGATRKYLLYAVGEILLVMIGILLALQVNNWNEDRKLRSSENQILGSLKNELEFNKHQLKEALIFHQISHDHCISILNLFNNNLRLISDNEIDSLISNIGIQHTFDSRHGFLESIISSGKINHIQNNKLVTLVSQYEDHVRDAIEFILPANSFFLNKILPELSKYYARNSPYRSKRESWSLVPISMFQSDYKQLFNNRVLESYLAQWSVSIKLTYEEEQVLLSTIEDMISIIEMEIGLENSK
jgi:hypothetical protein